MPLTSTQKAEILQQLRYWFNQTDTYLVESGRSLEFSDQVKTDVEEIRQKGLHKDVQEWGNRCASVRLKNGYTCDDVGELLGVSHKAIQMQEKKDMPASGDLFYLEAFSLIYHSSPYTLLGIKNPHLICPLISSNNHNCKYGNVIINHLYVKNSPEKLTYLETITKIGKLTSPYYTKLLSFLKDLAIFNGVFDVDPLQDITAENGIWRSTPLPDLLYSNECCSIKNNHWYIFSEAQCLINDLEKHNPMRLHVLAQLSLCSADKAYILKKIVMDAGFPKDPKSLKKYDIDNAPSHSIRQTSKLRKIRHYD